MSLVRFALLPLNEGGLTGRGDELFRLRHDTTPLGGYPSGVIREGMSADEVRALLGSPHEVHDHDPRRVSWLYYLDAIELDWFLVTFGPDGRVDHTGGS